jgi:hypothetical protein
MAGVVTAVVFVVSFILFGEPPALDDPAGDIRAYFEDSGSQIQFANWLIALAVALFFLVFASGLRGLLGAADADTRGMWSRASFAGAVAVAAIGGAGSAFWGTATLHTDSLSDDVLIALHQLDALLYQVAMPWGFALFLGAASLVIIRSGVLWAWLGWFGILTAVLQVVGALWPLSGDNEGFLGILGLIGLTLSFLWILIAGVGMMRMESPPAEA